MFKSLLAIMLALSLLTVVNGGVVSAAPVGGCPDGFHLHEVAGHEHPGDGDHPHKHVGVDTDHNGDGFICGKHVGKDGAVHVHIDNNIPLDTE